MITAGRTGKDEEVQPGTLLVDRRSVCAASLAIPLLKPTSAWSSAATPHSIRFVVTDQRYPQSLAFGEGLVNKGASRLDAMQGLTRIWRESLAPMWQSEGGSVCGLTRTETWSGLAEQARSSGRRTIFVAHHMLSAGNVDVSHTGTAPGGEVRLAKALQHAGDLWPAAMADMVSTYRGRRSVNPNARQGSKATGERQVSLALTTWIIA